MRDLNIVDRLKAQDKQDNRSGLQNISIMDSAMGKYGAALKDIAGSDKKLVSKRAGSSRRDQQATCCNNKPHRLWNDDKKPAASSNQPFS